MVETVSAASISGRDLAVSRVAQTPPAAPVSTARDETTAVATAITAARSLSQSAPIDTDHVAAVKKAIANNTFPISPATIADRLLALKLEWKTHDQA